MNMDPCMGMDSQLILKLLHFKYTHKLSEIVAICLEVFSKKNEHSMPKGNSEICFLETRMQNFVSWNIDILRKQNPLFP